MTVNALCGVGNEQVVIVHGTDRTDWVNNRTDFKLAVLGLDIAKLF